jgi:hypothetical protein
MEFNIIDNAGIRYTLDFEYRKLDANNLYFKIHAEIKQIVESEFKKISELLPNSENLKIKISLEQESKTDNNTTLGCFNVAISSENEFVFSLYYSSIKQLANKLLQIDSNETFSLASTFLHELIHAVDYHTLKETYINRTNDLAITKKTGYYNLNEKELSAHHKNVQWYFLSYFSTFRNEGIAILGEKLLGDQSTFDQKRDLGDSLQLFREQITDVLNASKGLRFYNKLEKHAVWEKLDQLSFNAYLFGDIIMLLLIENVHPKLEPIYKHAQDFILGKSKNILSKSEIHLLLKTAIDMDVSDVINGILRNPFFNDNQAVLFKKQLLECCAIIQDESNDEGISLFAKTIGVIGYNQSSKPFIETMKATIFSCMTVEEIKNSYKEFTTKKNLEDIFESVKKMAEKLYPLAVEENNETAKWALTYLLDDEDLIHDDITILGLQDDWLVLDAAINIVNT